MLQIVLIRPGSSDYSQQGRIQGTLSVPLNALGADEVAQSIPQLVPRGIEVVYSSPCEPALATAATVAAALRVKLKKLRGMENLNHGLWQGMLVEEVKRKQPTVYRQWQEQPESMCPPEGESLVEAGHRVDRALAKLLRRHRQGVVGLVLPEPLATLAKSRLGQGKLGDLWQAGTCHGGWQVLEIEPQSVVLSH